MPPINEKPSRNEDEYFLRYDAELLKARRAELDAARAAGTAPSTALQCPRDGGALVEREFHHVKVDVCSECGGMWFDKGEVDQLERVAPRGFFNALFGTR